MLINGPPVVQSNQRSDDSALVLRLNQRVVAEVLQVSGENVTLAIEGARVVARLTSSDQAAALQERRSALFIIKDISQNQILIQLAPNNAPLPPAPAASQDLAQALLARMGLANTDANLQILRAMLSQGLPADMATFGDIQNALTALGSWGAPEAQAAAVLKAAGLPLTPGSMALLINAPTQSVEAYSRLLSLLQGLSPRQVSPQAAAVLQHSLAMLRSVVTDWSGDASKMTDSLQRAIALLGQSVENSLARLANNGQRGNVSLNDANGLLALLALRRELARSGPREVVDAIDRFIDSSRLQHLNSSETEPNPSRGEWIQLNLPLRLSYPEGQPNARPSSFSEAHLRISRHRSPEGSEVDPRFTRLVVSVDLEDGATMEVDLSVVEHKVGLQVAASTNELCDQAKEEITSFTHALNQLGYDIQSSKFEVEKAKRPLEAHAAEISPERFFAVNLEI